jgi:protein TonB
MLKTNIRWILGISAAIAVGATSSAALADSAPKVDRSRPTVVIYPPASQARGEEGTVMLNVLVTTSGRAAMIDISKSSGFDDLDDAAVETAANWHYTPAVDDGDFVQKWTAVQITYKLPDTASSSK